MPIVILIFIILDHMMLVQEDWKQIELDYHRVIQHLYRSDLSKYLLWVRYSILASLG